jgi:glycerophosphoryl diester phosphodiesterase
MLALNLTYAALGFILLAPLPGVITRLLIRLSGKQALTDQDIAYFLLTPFGTASLIVVLAILVSIVALSQASMMFLGAANKDRGVSTLDALWFAVRHVRAILSFAFQLVSRVLLRVAPFLLGHGRRHGLVARHRA